MSMISELVDRLRVESKSMGTYGTDYMATLLMRSVDTIEMLSGKAREPKRGEWINKHEWSNGFFERECSVCGAMKPQLMHTAKINFCPNCGADMREREGE